MNKQSRPTVSTVFRLLSAVSVSLAITGCASSLPAPPTAQVLQTPSAEKTPARQPAPLRAVRKSADHRGSAAHLETTKELPANDLTPQLLYQFLAAEVASQRGQSGAAVATFLVLARETRDPRLARRATELALASGSLEKALEGAQLWHEYSPGSSVAAQTREMLLLSANRLDEAEPLLVAHRQRASEQNALPGFYRQLLRTLARASDPKGALALFERISAPDEKIPEARFANAELARAAGQPARAAQQAQAAYALAPDNEQYAMQAARLLRDGEQGMPAAAELLAGFLERKPAAIDVRLQYARLLSAMGKAEDAKVQMQLALKTDPDNPVILFSLAQLAYQAKRLDEAQRHLQHYLDLPRSVSRDNGPAHLFLAQIEEDRNRPDRAIEWLAKVNSGEQFIPALVRRSQLMAKSGQLEQARALLRGTQASDSRQRMQLVAAEAQLLHTADRSGEAFEVLDAALAQSPQDPDLLYDHAMAAERLDRIDVMEKSLRKLIELRPDNAHAHNALGYSLADRNLRLAEARTLIEKALELSPDDAHILDSMGWVLFRQGEAEKAIGFLERAYQLRPEPEVAVHLGEVLWQLGRKQAASDYWRKAREMEADNKLLRQTLKRLGVSL
jgi:tetratricopeptide (TPR) repeat protein